MSNPGFIQLCELELPAIPSAVQLGRQCASGIPQLIESALADPDQANSYMRMFYLMNALGSNSLALDMQAKALERRLLYRFAGPLRPAIRLLALMGPGNWTDNAPLEFLVADSDIRLELWFFIPDGKLPGRIPDHDLAIVALGESDKNLSLLEHMDAVLSDWPKPVLNQPRKIRNCARDIAYQLLKDIPGLLMPKTQRVNRDDFIGLHFPITIRPVGTHGGKGLAKLNDTDDLHSYLEINPDAEFYVAQYVDYHSADGLFRKTRIALIDGRPYVCHLAVSESWIVHYIPAGMRESEGKRQEESKMMESFDRDFAARHRHALAAIGDKLQLDYVVLDCTEMADGRLLLFEVDNGGWIHATDPADIFPYKRPIMQKAFDAFRNMLVKRAFDMDSAPHQVR